MCGLGEMIQRLQEITEGDGGYTTPETSETWSEPDFEGFGLSLVLPDGWETLEYHPSEGPSEMEVTWIKFAHVDGLEATVTCIMAPEMFEGKTADEVARYMVYAPDVEHPPTIDEGRITISGIRGYEASYVMEEPGEGTYTYRYIALASKRQSRIFSIDFARYGTRGFTSADKREMREFLDAVEID